MVSALLIAALLGAAPPEPEDPPEDAPAPSQLVLGRRYTLQLYNAQTRELWNAAGAGLKRQLGSEEGLKGYARKLKGDFGEELRVISERMDQKNGLNFYTRQSVFSLYARGVELQWAWDDSGQLQLASARPAVTEAPSPYERYEVKTKLLPPFDATVWNVLWGGRTWDDNRHASVSDQRYALDLFIWKGNGTFSGDGTKNEQYYCFGKPVLAPGEGIVVFVEDGLSDNAPGQVNPLKLYGNHVVIDHRNGEFSLLAHLQKGSISVKTGQRVYPATVIAKAGNSGVSTEPHLHYQLMDNRTWVNAHGLPVKFAEAMIDGAKAEQVELKRGQQVSRLK